MQNSPHLELAAEAEEWARSTPDAELRRLYTGIADGWRSLAEVSAEVARLKADLYTSIDEAAAPVPLRSARG